MPSGGVILDAGCGAGGMLKLLKKDYPRTVGIDSSTTAVEFCKMEGGDVFEGTVMSLPFVSDTFDGVISLDVLYHEGVEDDAAAMKEMTRTLKPGGYLFLQLPAYECMRSYHDKTAHAARRYTSAGLKTLLAECDLQTIRISYRVTFLFPLALIKRKLFRSGDSDMKAVNSLLNRLFRSIMAIENALLRIINMPFGLSVIAIARKRVANSGTNDFTT